MSIWLKSMPHARNALFMLGFDDDRFGHCRLQLRTHCAIAGVSRRSRCDVVALAGSNAARAGEFAHAAGVSKAYGDWRALVEDPSVQAVAIATVPSLQAQIAIHALAIGKPVFAEKPMAGSLSDAYAMLQQARATRLPAMIDFNFPQIVSWQRAKTMIDAGAIGSLRHLAVHWHVENCAVQARMRNWKTLSDDAAACLVISSAIVSIIWNGSAARSLYSVHICRRSPAMMTCKPPRRWRSNLPPVRRPACR